MNVPISVTYMSQPCRCSIDFLSFKTFWSIRTVRNSYDIRKRILSSDQTTGEKHQYATFFISDWWKRQLWRFSGKQRWTPLCDFTFRNRARISLTTKTKIWWKPTTALIPFHKSQPPRWVTVTRVRIRAISMIINGWVGRRWWDHGCCHRHGTWLWARRRRSTCLASFSHGRRGSGMMAGRRWSWFYPYSTVSLHFAAYRQKSWKQTQLVLILGSMRVIGFYAPAKYATLSGLTSYLSHCLCLETNSSINWSTRFVRDQTTGSGWRNPRENRIFKLKNVFDQRSY